MMENLVNSFKEVGEISDDGLFVYNFPENKIVYCNEGLCKILGITSKSITGNGLDEIRKTIREEEHFLQYHIEVLKATSKISDLEVRLENGKAGYVSCDAFLINNGVLVVGFVKDITNVKSHANYIIEFGARKDAILDMVAHNLSGPLNLTNNLLNLVDQISQGQYYKKIDGITSLIRENTQQCIEVINAFLKEEHLQSEHIFVKSTRFDVISKIEIVISTVQPFRHDKPIKLICKSNEVFINGDDVKFAQVIHNLLSNAVKFSASGNNIFVEVFDGVDKVSISVKDFGIGIPEYLQPHIFKKNTPAGRPGLRGEKSIGMGLYIVKQLVELMRGEITFKSEENRGTTFTLTIPKE